MNCFSNKFTVAVRPDGTVEITFQYVTGGGETDDLETVVMGHADFAALINAGADALEQFAEVKKKGAN